MENEKRIVDTRIIDIINNCGHSDKEIDAAVMEIKNYAMVYCIKVSKS